MALTVTYNSGDSLITSQEVVDSTPVANNSYADLRTPFIAMKEEKLFRKCFGWAFYVDLMADKVSYKLDNSGDEQYVNFREGTSYTLGLFVLHEGRLYEVIKATTGTQRPSLEVQNEYFKLAPKFATVEYNFIWERYLKGIIAFSITESSLFYRIVKDTAKGILPNYDDNQERTLWTEINALKSEYAGDVGDMIANMEAFILENKTLAVFANYKPIAEPCAEGCGSRRKHYGFNTNPPEQNAYFYDR